MKEKLLVLVDLQRVESEVGIIRSKLCNVAAVLEGLEARIAGFEGTQQETEGRLQALQKHYRQHESDVQMNQARIKKSQEKLGSVKNNKEYQSILKEIEDMQAKNSLIEDQMIASLEEIETVERAIHALKNEMKEIRAQVDTEKMTIEHDRAQNQRRLGQLEKDIERISALADPELLRKYRLVKEQTRGVAIAAVNNAVCLGCNLNIPPQMYNELQRSETLTMCPHCQRIIYWEGSQ